MPLTDVLRFPYGREVLKRARIIGMGALIAASKPGRVKLWNPVVSRSVHRLADDNLGSYLSDSACENASAATYLGTFTINKG